MTVSKLISMLEGMKRLVGYDCNVVFFSNGYKEPNVNIGYIQVPGRFESYIIINGAGDIFPNAEDCIDKQEE